MFVETSVLQGRPISQVERDTRVIPSIWLPHYSNRLELVDTKEKCFYDGLSKRVVVIEATKELRRRIERALSRLLLLYVGTKFRFWYNLINRDSINRKTHKRYYPNLITDNVTEIWPYRKGLQIIVPYLVEIYGRKARSAFRNWKLYLREIRILLMRMFNRWSVKTSRWKLNRLNAARFLRLTEPWGRRIRQALRRYYWPIFRHACDLVLIRRHVKLLFRCWHTVVCAMRRGRKLVKHRTLVLLWENKFEEQRRQEEMIAACIAIQSKHLTRTILHVWRHAYRRRCLIKRVLMSYCNGSLRKGWVTWVRNVFPAAKVRTPPPSPPRRRPPPAPTPAPDTSHYRKRTSRLPRVPPHIVMPLAGLHSYAMVHSPGVTETDRIHFRLHRLEHHVQLEEERARERMQASGEDFLTLEEDGDHHHQHQHNHQVSLVSPAGGRGMATPRQSRSTGKSGSSSSHNSGVSKPTGIRSIGNKSATAKTSSGGRPPSGRPKSASSTIVRTPSPAPPLPAPASVSRSPRAPIGGGVPSIKRSSTPPTAAKKPSTTDAGQTKPKSVKYPHTPYF